MPLREFVDERGRRWMVWDVNPTLVERRLRNVGPPRGVTERRRHGKPHGPIRLTEGWLAFEATDGERRRLAPIPTAGWAEASEEELRSWCGMAVPRPPARRLVE